MFIFIKMKYLSQQWQIWLTIIGYILTNFELAEIFYEKYVNSHYFIIKIVAAIGTFLGLFMCVTADFLRPTGSDSLMQYFAAGLGYITLVVRMAGILTKPDTFAEHMRRVIGRHVPDQECLKILQFSKSYKDLFPNLRQLVRQSSHKKTDKGNMKWVSFLKSELRMEQPESEWPDHKISLKYKMYVILINFSNVFMLVRTVLMGSHDRHFPFNMIATIAGCLGIVLDMSARFLESDHYVWQRTLRMMSSTLLAFFFSATIMHSKMY